MASRSGTTALQSQPASILKPSRGQIRQPAVSREKTKQQTRQTSRRGDTRRDTDATGYVYSFPKQQILDSSKMKEFADDTFKFDENGRKLFKWVENTVGKGEIARYEQFLLFPHCFQKDLYCKRVKIRACLGKG